MITAALIIGALLGVLVSGFVSAVETGSYCLNRVRLRVRAEQGDPSARRLAGLLERTGDVVLTALLGNTVADFVCTACVTALLLRALYTPSAAELWATVIVTPVLLTLGGILPKDWFRREADRWMYQLAVPITVCVIVARATGFLWLMRHVTRRLARFDAGSPEETRGLPRAHMLRLLHEGAALGGLSPFQRDLIDRVMKLHEVRVSSVMIPLARAATVPHTIARANFLRIARMAHFSRLPVWEGNPRNVIGVIMVFDVLTDTEQRPIASYARPAFTLAESTNVATALLRMQRARETMAIVQDRRGQCVGVLTLKDLAEEIVGDLEVW